MNILYLAHRIPFPPDKGDKIRSFHQIEHLAKYHKVWCAFFLDDVSDRRHLGRLGRYCVDMAAVRLQRGPAILRGLYGLASGRTLTETYYKSAEMSASLHRWTQTRQFDAVVAFSSSMAPYALQVPTSRRVLDLCDLDSRKWMDYADSSKGPARYLYRTEGRRLAEQERDWAEAFDATLLITETEAKPIRRYVNPGRVHVVGNGVSLPVDTDGHRAHPPTVGFVGVMDYRPNVDAVCWFVSNCWHEIRTRCPSATLRIVGRSPTRRVRRLNHIPGVRVVGEVDDVTAELRGFDLSIAPMRIARGLQNKVLEAMAAAKPVVLTCAAADGIKADHNREFFIADTPVAISANVSWLLNDETARSRMGQAARSFVAANHRWEGILRRFELIVTRAVERSADRTDYRTDRDRIENATPERLTEPV